MGLDIQEYSILDGLVTLTDLYGHVRDIRINKNEDTFIIESSFLIYKNQKCIEVLHIMKEYGNDFLTKTWEDIYNIVKEKLTNMGIVYVDN